MDEVTCLICSKPFDSKGVNGIYINMSGKCSFCWEEEARKKVQAILELESKGEL